MDDIHYRFDAPDKEIRLLDLLPPTSSGRLAGRLSRVPIDDTPPFISVSHVWGTEKAATSMHVESGSCSMEVTISKNLESLLLSLLCRDAASLPQIFDDKGSMLPLWIDMACINQADVDEKVSQIPLMRQIFSQGKAVIIWINESRSQLVYAFHYLRQIIRSEPDVKNDRLWTLFDPIGWDSIRDLVECDWFQRRWIVQEAVIPLQAVFLCSGDVMTMDDVFHGVEIAAGALLARPTEMKKLKYATTGAIRPIKVLKQLRGRRGEDHKHHSLLWLSENLRTSRATLAHDQVFGLLGLCSPEEAASNPIRYDIDPEEVFRVSVEAHARLHGDLNFLALCTSVQRGSVSPDIASPARPFRGPSWVPNWHSAELQRALGLQSVDQSQYFNAAGSMAMKSVFNGNELQVYGVMIDKIDSVRDIGQSVSREDLKSPESSLYQQYFDFWMSAVVSGEPSPYGSSESHAEAFSRTVCLHGVQLDVMPSRDIAAQKFHGWCKGSSLEMQLENLGFGRRLATLEPYLKPFVSMKRLSSFRPFVTRKGYIGFSRPGCAAGDEVWIIAGCSVPIVLSPIERTDRGRRHKVLGESLMDGFMFGEGVDGSVGTVGAEIVTLA